MCIATEYGPKLFSEGVIFRATAFVLDRVRRFALAAVLVVVGGKLGF